MREEEEEEEGERCKEKQVGREAFIRCIRGVSR